MISGIFTWLSKALYANPLIALFASFIWGTLSILLSPCHLTSIPLIISFISGQEDISTKRASLLSTLFALGILITIALVGLITSLLGRIIGDVGTWGNYFAGIIFIIVGLYLGDIIKLPLPTTATIGYQKKGLGAVFTLGLIFGIALGPCTFAYMAPILGVSFNIARHNFLLAFFLLLFYALGHCSVIIVAGTSIEIVKNYLQWGQKSPGIAIIKKVCGIMLLLSGIYLIWTCYK